MRKHNLAALGMTRLLKIVRTWGAAWRGGTWHRRFAAQRRQECLCHLGVVDQHAGNVVVGDVDDKDEEKDQADLNEALFEGEAEIAAA